MEESSGRRDEVPGVQADATAPAMAPARSCAFAVNSTVDSYEGRIERVDLDHHTGGRVPRRRQPQRGTWVFRFTMPSTPAAATVAAALAD